MDVSLTTKTPPTAHRARARAGSETTPELPADLGAPSWVADLMGRPTRREAMPSRGRLHESVAASERFTLVTVRVNGAAELSPAEFERHTAGAYGAIAKRLQSGSARNPVRFWNYIPGIHRDCGDQLDRYMVFNAGRFAACSEWLGGPEAFDRLLATASGVGHTGDDLVIHALAADAPGVAVENPRQTPPYRYSRRFGPRPPCFARATVLHDVNVPVRRLILVGGTASIRGEDSMHVGDVRAQCVETFDNLAALVRHAAETTAGAPGRMRPSAGLHDFRDLRVYHTRRADRSVVAPLIDEAFPQLRRVEYVLADLCRAELLVEIEGLAHVGGSESLNP